MKIMTTVLLLFLLVGQLNGQRIIEEYISQTDSLRIGNGNDDFFRYGDKGFTLILPGTTNNIKGILISFEDKKYAVKTNNKQQIYWEAIAKNIAVLYVSTGFPLTFSFPINPSPMLIPS